MVKQTLKAKKALRPIPGAKAKGSLAYKAISKVVIPEAITVVVNSAPLSMPAADKMFGFTARM